MRRYSDGWGREQSESSKKLINSRIVEVVGQDSRLRSVLERLTEYEASLGDFQSYHFLIIRGLGDG